MRVELGRRQRGVPEQLLHRPQVGASLEQVGGGGVPQPVRADVGRALRRLRDGWLRALTVGAAGILAAVMTHNLVENLHVLNMNLHFFAILALPALALRVECTEHRAPSPTVPVNTRDSGLGTRNWGPA